MKTIILVLLAVFVYCYLIQGDERFCFGEAELKEERVVEEKREKRDRKW